MFTLYFCSDAIGPTKRRRRRSEGLHARGPRNVQPENSFRDSVETGFENHDYYNNAEEN